MHSVDDLRERCDVLGEADCWLWRGATSRGRPMARFGEKTVGGQHITAVVLGRAIERKAHQRWGSLCNDAMCMAPHHLVLRTQAQAQRAASKAGRLKRDAVSIARIQRALVECGRAHPDAVVRAVMESPLSAKAVSREMQIPYSTVKQWRNGSARTSQTAGMFDQLLRVAA